MLVRIKKGLDLNIGTDPGTSMMDSMSTSISALLGRDYPGVKLQILVKENSQVRAGQAVMCDRRRPEIQFTSPSCGVISSIDRGPRRSLKSVQITAGGKPDGVKFEIPAVLDLQGIRELMLQAGLWPALRSRPFGYIPDPSGNPTALLISAIDTQPLAPNPAAIISKYSREFTIGLKLLCDMVESPVFLCKSADQKFEYDDTVRARTVDFSGPHPAGLVGTHIQTLCPVGFDGNQIWHIGYQDVISLGHLKLSGKPWQERVVSLAGSAANNPRYITVPLGADIDDIATGELANGAIRIISGSILSGHHATGSEAFLGRYHNQISTIFESNQAQPKGWLSRIFDPEFTVEPGPLIPTPDLDNLSPPGILAVPFLRALLVGDIERARDLGALELLEEDLALLSYFCPSKTDYGPLLRNVLNQIDKEGLSIRS